MKMGKSTISMTIFNGYVKLPEGMSYASYASYAYMSLQEWGRTVQCN